ncbi:MAG: response regulator [Opitutales bacterium]
MNILYAEDKPSNQASLQAQLAAIGCSVDLANDGQACIDKMKEKAYDLVLLDVQMPRLNGLEVAQKVRAGEAGEANKEVFLVALTAYALQGDRQMCIDAGMNDYLSKPLRLKTLRDLVDQAGKKAQA